MLKRFAFATFIIILLNAVNTQGAILLDRVVAIVNKEVITWGDLYKAMEFEATDAVKSMNEADRRRFFKESEGSFLELLIDARLQLQEAVKAGIAANNDDVNNTIDGIKKKHSLSDDMFAEAIKKEGFAMSEYRIKLAEQITIGRVIEHEVRSKIAVTEKEIDSYLRESKELSQGGDGFNIAHIFLKKGVNDKKTEERAKELYKRIKAGESFRETAMKESEDAAAKNGGEMGFIYKAEISKEFLNALMQMKEGEISEPFWGGNGMHILKLNEKKEYKTAHELRDAVKQKLISERFIKEYKNWIKGLREKAYVEIKI
ncbi:MAG: peptidylprolyl isomerase [Nitrospirae bacterium]|nr:peptidylprolyl isomerase [Nitrospirota bacterium]